MTKLTMPTYITIDSVLQDNMLPVYTIYYLLLVEYCGLLEARLWYLVYSGEQWELTIYETVTINNIWLL